jgi:hypothetical protein
MRMAKPFDVMLNRVKYLADAMPLLARKSRFFDCGLKMTLFRQAAYEPSEV